MSDAAIDRILLEQAIAGDEAAFSQLYERHWELVYRFAFRIVNSVEAAQDITHDCFVSLIKHPDRYNPNLASLSTYLCAAARNLALKQFRRTENELLSEDEAFVPNQPSRDRGPLQQVLDRELAAVVQQAIAELPVLQREALVLFEFEELSLAEVATVAGTDVGTIKSRLSRARERLKKVFAPYFQPQ